MHIAVFSCNFNLFAAKTDTLKIYKTQKIEVNTERMSNESGLQSSAYRMISSSEIQSVGAVQLTDILKLSPGIDIKNYGGASGMKTISLRGTGASRAAVMIDGFVINSAQNGMTDFSSLPIGNISEIEIVRGGASAVYGSNALGGAVNIITAKNDKRGFMLETRGGSFGEYGIKAAYSGLFSAAFEHLFSKGDFPFSFDQFGETKEYRRGNAEFANTHLSIGFKSNSNIFDYHTKLFVRSTKRGVPGAVVQGRLQADNAELTEKEITSLSGAAFLFNNGIFKTGLMVKISDMRYIDPDLPGQSSVGTDNFFNTRDVSAELKYIKNIENVNFEIGVRSAYSNLRGDMIDENLKGDIVRKGLAFLTKFDKVYSCDNLDILPLISLRLDMFSDTKPNPSAIAGIRFMPKDWNLQFRANWSYNFRVPSFNEMYYLNFGNSNLKPERSNSLSLGADYDIDGINFSVDMFGILTKDMITAVPKSTVAWTAENIGKTFSRGLELGASGSIKTLFISNFSAAYTIQKVTDETNDVFTSSKQIVYTPNETASLHFIFDLQYFNISASADYSGFRYTSRDNNPITSLPAFLTFDTAFIKNINTKYGIYSIRAECRNILDKHYSVILNYPMPGRYFGLLFSFSNFGVNQ